MNVVDFLSAPWGQRVGWALVHFLWQGALVAGLMGAVLQVLRRKSPQVRYAAACVGLATMVVLPLVTAAVITVKDLPAAEARGAGAGDGRGTILLGRTGGRDDGNVLVNEGPLPLAPRLVRDAASPRGVTLESARAGWMERARGWVAANLPWAILAWMVGAAGLSLWHMGGWMLLRRMQRSGKLPGDLGAAEMFGRLMVRMKVQRTVRLLESAMVRTPVVIGWLRPVILLPVGVMTGLSLGQVEAILAHELAHVRRWDCLVRMVQAGVETVLFFHPAVWWMSGRVTQESEHCCDEIAVEICGDREGYARALAELAGVFTMGTRLGAAAGGGRLLPRLRRILGVSGERRSGRTLLAAVAGLALVIAVIGVPLACSVGKRDQNQAAKLAEKSRYDGFVGYSMERINGGIVPTALLEGTLGADGQISTHLVKSKLLANEDQLRGLDGGKLYISAYGKAKGVIVGVRTGKGEVVAPEDPKILSRPAMDDYSVRGARRLFWDVDQPPGAIRLILQDSKDMNWVVLWEHVQYSEPPTNIASPRPPLVWLDDSHVLTMHTVGGNAMIFTGEDETVVVDVATKEVRALGRMPTGLTALLPPRGAAGDAAVIVNPGIVHQDGAPVTNVYAVSVAEVATGHGKLEMRDVKWGDFTLGGAITPYPNENGAAHVEELKCGGLMLGKDVTVTVSPDGKRAIWRVREKGANQDGAALYFCDSAEKKVREVFRTPVYVSMPLWTTRSDMGVVAEEGTATRPSAEAAGCATELVNQLMALPYDPLTWGRKKPEALRQEEAERRQLVGKIGAAGDAAVAELVGRLAAMPDGAGDPNGLLNSLRWQLIRDISSIGDKALPSLQKTAAKAGELQRGEMVEAMAGVRTPAGTKALIPYLDDKTEFVRMEAVSGLTARLGEPAEQGGGPQILRALVKHVSKESKVLTRLLICGAMRKVLKPAPPAEKPEDQSIALAVGMLRERLKGDSSASIRVDAACILTEFGDFSGEGEIKKAVVAMKESLDNSGSETYALPELVGAIQRISGRDFGPVPRSPMIVSNTRGIPALKAARKELVQRLFQWAEEKVSPSTTLPTATTRGREEG